ncbi:MAG: ParB/RepB/Spo0J family partition protein [Tenericutes bacterium]|nr:ParB/RepB/Spo0J family partition protein [Mycoplasmatota bacterium]
MNTENKDEVVYLYLDDIIPNRFQPREVFDEKALKELALSIREHGVIQPIIVRNVSNGKYEIIAGERRYKASALAGLTKIPALIRNLDDKESSKVALLENLQRRNLNPVEEARTLQKILELDQMTQEELAKSMGKSQSSVANKLRLLNLPDEVLDALLKEQISERHARALLNVPDSKKQKEFLKKIINNKLSVRVLEEEIAAAFPKGGDVPASSSFLEQTPIKPANITEEKTEEYGTVKIVPPTENEQTELNQTLNIPLSENIIAKQNSIVDTSKEGEGMPKYVDYSEYSNEPGSIPDLTLPPIPNTEAPMNNPLPASDTFLPIPGIAPATSTEEIQIPASNPLVDIPTAPLSADTPSTNLIPGIIPETSDITTSIIPDNSRLSSTSPNANIDIQGIKDRSVNIKSDRSSRTAGLDDLLNIDNNPIKRAPQDVNRPKMEDRDSAPSGAQQRPTNKRFLTAGEAVVKNSENFAKMPKSKDYFDTSDIAAISMTPGFGMMNPNASVSNPALIFNTETITPVEATDKIKALCEEIEKHGVKVSVDEMNFDTTYQIMIRVDK